MMTMLIYLFSDEEKRGNESPHLVLMAVYLDTVQNFV